MIETCNYCGGGDSYEDDEGLDRCSYCKHVLTNPEFHERARIEQKMGELVDLLAASPSVEIDPRAWCQLMIYHPKSYSRFGLKGKPQ